MPDQRQKVMKHVPYEIIFQILIRLPVKSLLQFQLVCKLWFSMITSDRAIIRAHLRHVKHRNDPSFRRHLIVSNSNMFSYGLLNLDKRSSYDPIPFRNYKNVDILASCDGLVLFSENEQYYLGNPSTGLYKPFKLGQYTFKDQCETYGLGYDEASEAYKVVRILRVATHRNFMMHQRAIGAHEYDATSIKVYNCRTESWKRIGDPFPYNIYTNAQAVVVNGAPHWMVFRNDDEGEMRDYVIIYFDLGEEKFKEVGAPSWLGHRSSFELCDYNKRLCLVKYGMYTIEIWVMKQYGVATSWTRIVTLKRRSSRGAVPLFCSEDGKLLLLIDRNSLGIVDLINNTRIDASDVKRVTFYGECTMTTYVETLVSPFTGRDQAVR